MLKQATQSFAAILIALTCGPSALAQTAPASVAKVAPVTDTYHGVKVVDPYRWMESADGEFLDWARAQDRVTRSELSSLPGYRALHEQTSQSVDADAHVSRVMSRGGQIYYRRRDPGKAQPCLFVRPLSGGPERLLIDPVALAGPTTTLGVAVPSPDGRYLVYTLSDGGSEESTLYILDLKTGHRLPETYDRARFADPAWSQDSRFLYFNRLQAGGAGKNRFDNQTILRHRVGDKPVRDVPVFRSNATGSKLGKGAFVDLAIPSGSSFAIASANSGVSAASELWVASVRSLQTRPHWRKIAGLEDQIESFDFGKDGTHAWFVTFHNAPHRKVIQIDLRLPSPLSRAKTVIPETGEVLKSIAAAKDGLFISYAGGPGTSLYKVAGDGRRMTLAIPPGSRVRDLAADTRQAGAIVSIEGWTLPRGAYSVSPKGLTDLNLTPRFPMDLSQLSVVSLMATARDGTQVPVDLIRRKDLPPGAPGSTLVEAYGAYGESMDPFFDATMMPFLLHGATYAVAHVRGGGELGEAWHLGGQKATKPNTWRDYIAVVEALERAGYATRGRVAGLGVSAGGIMIGRTVTDRPDLLAAALMWAPMTNTLRFKTTEGGPGNTAEFGSVATREGFEALNEMDSYTHVVEGVSYPAVLLTGGVNDHRVPVWMAGQMAARLQAATRSGKPVRLRIDFEGGHHTMGVSKADEVSQSVDSWAFVLQHTGDPDFQPKASSGQ